MSNPPAGAPKKRRSADGLVQFSLNVELPSLQKNRLLAIKDRLKMAKDYLKLSKKTSSTQDADLMESLLLAFEEKMERRDGSLSLQTSPSTPSRSSHTSFSDCSSPLLSSSPIHRRPPISVATSTPERTSSIAFGSPSPFPPLQSLFLLKKKSALQPSH